MDLGKEILHQDGGESLVNHVGEWCRAGMYKYWIGPLGKLRVARDGRGIRTSSTKLLLADRTWP